MSRSIGVCLAALTICIISVGATLAQPPQPADLVAQGGKVHTLDAKDTVASAVAIRGERIVFVGSDEDAKKYVGPKTEIHNAAGRTVIPGLNETHVHPTGAAQGEVGQRFTQLHSIGDIQDWVRQQVV